MIQNVRHSTNICAESGYQMASTTTMGVKNFNPHSRRAGIGTGGELQETTAHHERRHTRHSHKDLRPSAQHAYTGQSPASIPRPPE